jgi:hypothetical protein
MIDRARQPLYWLIFAAFCGLLTTIIYGASLMLPFFFDDFVHYPFVEANNMARIWLTTDELAYYRPLNFTLWRLTYDFFQRHNPFVDHAINLLLHAVNGFLAGWLAARLWSLHGDRFPVVASDTGQVDWQRVYLSASLFLLFPFSYQAVPWVGSLSHLLVTTLILLAVLCYVQMRRMRVRPWGLASLFFTMLAPFAHENGLLVMPFVVLVDLTTPGLSRRWRLAARTAVIWTVPLMIYIPIWLSLPRLESGGLFSNSLEGMVQNSTYFLQGVFYPFTSLGGWLHYTQQVNDMTAVFMLSGLGLLVALLIQLTQKATLRALLPWLWAILASLPAILFLVFDYVINGPRLLMVASVGVTWLWADVILLFSRGGKRGSSDHYLRAGIALVATFLLLGQNISFIRERMTMHEILGDGFMQVIDATTKANDAAQEAIVINFPSWLAPKDHAYALGHEGVLFWPDYVPPEILMAVHTGALGDLNFVKVDGTRPDLESYYYGLTGPNPNWGTLSAVPSQVFNTDYEVDSVELARVGSLGDFRTEDHGIVAVFNRPNSDGRIQLLDARATQSDGAITVDTVWQAENASPQTTLFVHLVDSAGNLVAQADGDPLGGSYPLDQWQDGAHVQDSRTIALEDAAGLAVRLGLYDRVTGERLQAASESGEPFADSAVPILP